MTERKMIAVEITVYAPIEKAWAYWTEPKHITCWNNASDDWHTPHATNDLREGGTFLSRMEAKDGGAGFDFNGTYTQVIPLKEIAYTMEGGRKVTVLFEEHGEETHIIEHFEAEDENPVEMQQQGWQSILDNFKKYVESQK
jgi:uncharacterized protein YndB with AHSA1/START domain